jgi:hypothetical protein
LALLNNEMENIKRIIHEIYNADARPVGALLSAVLLIWGVVLLSPGDTFSLSVLYAPMYYYFPSRHMAEVVWGLIYFIIGCISTLCLFGPKNKLLHYLLLPGVFLFIFTAITFGRTSLYAIGPWLHGLFAIFMMWRYIRRSQAIV